MKTQVLCLLSLLLIHFPLQLPAQIQDNSESPIFFTIQGEVQDSISGETLIGVNIYLKDTKYGTVSDFSGNFSLEARGGNYLLVFSYIGYKQKEVVLKLNRNISLNIILSPTETPIEEVQITAQRKFFGNMDYGREIPIISTEVIERQNTNNASDILHARLAGVWATKTSGAPGDHQKIRIRGQSSFFSSAEPLYVVDGVPVPIVNLSSLGIADLNIHDIESVTVLKDASSTSLYGFQGGNGVVLIDTKQGGENEIDFSVKYGYQWFDNYYDLMSSEEQLASLETYHSISGSSLVSYYPPLSDSLCNTDRQKEIFSPGSIREYQFSTSGAKKLIKYYFSGNYIGHNGIIPNSEYTRYTFSSRIGRIFWKKLAIDLAYRGSVQKNKNNQNQYRGNRLIWEGISKSPCLECTPDSLIYFNPSTLSLRINDDYYPLNQPELPQTIIENNTHELDITTHAMSGFARFQITDHLSMDVMESLMLRKTRYIANFEYYIFSSYDYIGLNHTKLNSKEEVILFNHQMNLSYYNTYGNHNLGAVLANRYYNDNLWWRVDSLEGTIPEHYSLKNSMAAYGPKGSVLRRMNSYIGHISYNYKGKYFVSSITNISHIKEGMYINYYCIFPSLALNWDMAQEWPLKNISHIDHLNLYINWGKNGNYPLNGLANDLYEDVPYTLGDTTGYHPSILQFANHHLKHENTVETDYGIKFSFFDERITLNAAYFSKTIKDLIIQRDIPYYYGGGKQYLNIGRLSVTGYELGIELVPIQIRNFTWFLMFNYSTSSQRVEKLDEGKSLLFIDSDLLMPEFIINEGESLGNIYGYNYLGEMTNEDWENQTNKFVQVNEGKFLNADSTDSRLTEDDKVIIGNSIPDFTWNFTNSFWYRNFSIDFHLYAVWGLQKYNATRAATLITGVNNDINNYISDTIQTIRTSFFYESSAFIEDASFIRLKTLSLNYELVKELFGKVNFGFTLSFENLVTITKFKGYDPEATIFTDNNFSDNSIDRGSYPNPRAMYFAIKLKF